MTILSVGFKVSVWHRHSEKWIQSRCNAEWKQQQRKRKEYQKTQRQQPMGWKEYARKLIVAKVVIFEEFMFSVYIISKEYLCKFILCAAAVVCVCVSTGLFTYFLLFSLSLRLSTKFQCINISNQIINRKWMFYYMLIMSYCRCLKKRIQSIMNVPYNHHHFTVLPSRQSTFRTTTWAATNAHKKRGTHSIYSA